MFQLPQDDAMRQKIKSALQEAVNSKVRVDAEKDLQKNIYDALKEHIDITRKEFNVLVKAHYKQDLQQEVDELSNMDETYQILYPSANSMLG